MGEPLVKLSLFTFVTKKKGKEKEKERKERLCDFKIYITPKSRHTERKKWKGSLIGILL